MLNIDVSSSSVIARTAVHFINCMLLTPIPYPLPIPFPLPPSLPLFRIFFQLLLPSQIWTHSALEQISIFSQLLKDSFWRYNASWCFDSFPLPKKRDKNAAFHLSSRLAECSIWSLKPSLNSNTMPPYVPNIFWWTIEAVYHPDEPMYQPSCIQFKLSNADICPAEPIFWDKKSWDIFPWFWISYCSIL